MMYYLNKIVGFFLNPIGIALALLVLSYLCSLAVRFRRFSRALVIVACGWVLLASMPFFSNLLLKLVTQGVSERRVEEYPKSDAIVVLGGGVGASTNGCPLYAEMYAAADRVWHAARLYRAGKAPLVIPTGDGDRESAVPLLRDLGVPESAIRGEFDARNTEENARYVQGLLNNGGRILLVTSSWHMRRALLMFRRYAPKLEVLPAPTDYEYQFVYSESEAWRRFVPNLGTLLQTGVLFKEFVAYWGYRLLR